MDEWEIEQADLSLVAAELDELLAAHEAALTADFCRPNESAYGLRWRNDPQDEQERGCAA